MLKQGTTGTLLNSVNFWKWVLNRDFEVIEWLEETFGYAEKLAV
jgi:hypothetical protein